MKESGSHKKGWTPSDSDILKMENFEGAPPGAWIQGRQGRLRVDDGGSGAGIPLLFVHGNGGNRTQWAAQLAHLRATRRAVAFDLHEDFTRRWFEGILVKGTDATKTAVFRSLRATRPEAFIAATTGLYTFDPAAALASYRGPWLHVASYLADNPVAIHRAFAGMPGRVIQQASHWLMMDRPEEFNRILDDFLEGVK